MKKPFTSILNEPTPVPENRDIGLKMPALDVPKAFPAPKSPPQPAASEQVRLPLPPKPGVSAKPAKKAERGRPVEHWGTMHAFNFKMEEDYANIVFRAVKLELHGCKTIAKVMKDAIRFYAKHHPELLVLLPHEKNRQLEQ